MRRASAWRHEGSANKRVLEYGMTCDKWQVRECWRRRGEFNVCGGARRQSGRVAGVRGMRGDNKRRRDKNNSVP
ncbi:hypothetical protein COLU111180_01105 [Cohnella lubricantis]